MSQAKILIVVELLEPEPLTCAFRLRREDSTRGCNTQAAGVVPQALDVGPFPPLGAAFLPRARHHVRGVEASAMPFVASIPDLRSRMALAVTDIVSGSQPLRLASE